MNLWSKDCWKFKVHTFSAPGCLRPPCRCLSRQPTNLYKPAPYKEEKLPPQPFAYEYGVADDYSKANFKKAETQDAYGNVAGSFTIALPDGRLQTTTYTADHENGFVAEVTYSGTAQYPPEPAAGYGHAAPAYKPAPYAG